MELWHIIFWATLTVILIGTEVLTVQLVSIWFGIGSIIAFISSFFIPSFFVQTVIFIITSILLLLITRPIVKNYISKDNVKTNVDSLIGEKCIVIQDINNTKQSGRVFVNGLDWAAKSCDDSIILKDTTCSIVDIKGVTLLVKAL